MRSPYSCGVAVLVVLTLPTARATVVFAQSTPGGGETAGGAPAAAGGGAEVPGMPQAGTATRSESRGSAQGGAGGAAMQTFPVFPGGVAPTPPGKPLGGGNVTSSSSMPITGDETDSFDLLPRRDANPVVRGSANGPIFTRDTRVRMAGDRVPDAHVVKKGDTLWDISESYYRNPYQWPRLWSYNPQVKNPNWIYPGDEIRLREPGRSDDAGAGASARAGQGARLVERRRVAPATVFLREQGFIANDVDDDWGEITGAPEDKMFLSDFDDLYVRIGPGHDVRVGQELSIFRPVRSAPGGKVIQIQGTVRINQWDPRERVARATMIETLDVVERGARVGPIPRRFEVVAPVRNTEDVTARVVASVHHHEFYGQNQVVFLDRGSKAGLQPGNRMFVVRKGDAWRRSLPSDRAATRIALESESAAQIERVPAPRNEKNYPEEVIGELRIVAVRDATATAIVTQSTREIDPKDEAVARKGY